MPRFIFLFIIALTSQSLSVNASEESKNNAAQGTADETPKKTWKNNFDLVPLFKNKSWEMSAELGFLTTSGNNESTSLLAKADAHHEWYHWDFKYKFEARFVQNEKFDQEREKNVLKTTQERYLLELNSSYQVTDTSSAFVFYSYVDDRFAPYVEYTTIVGGYEFRAFEDNNEYLDLNIGPGYARGLTSEEELEKGLILRGSAKHQWDISDSAKLVNEVSVGSARFNTQTVAQSYIRTKINDSMQLKVGLKATHNTKVENDRENLDTETSVTLVIHI